MSMEENAEQRVAVVIEDDDDIRHLLETVLTQAGFRVVATSNGADGVEAVRANDPVVTTLDVNMPGMDGFETARRIRAFSATYIVMLTALNEEIDTLQGLEAGADDYVNKPFRPRELRARIEAMLRRPRLAFPEDGAAAGNDQQRPAEAPRAAEPQPIQQEQPPTQQQPQQQQPYAPPAPQYPQQPQQPFYVPGSQPQYQQPYAPPQPQYQQPAAPAQPQYQQPAAPQQPQYQPQQPQPPQYQQPAPPVEQPQAQPPVYEQPDLPAPHPIAPTVEAPAAAPIVRGTGGGWLEHNKLWLNIETRVVKVDDNELDLTRSEFDLLAALLESNRRVRTKADLVLLLRGESYVTSHFISEADKRAIEVHMGNLRKKLGDNIGNPRWIETVRGVGYRLTASGGVS
jgi:DNA-binding response OmpR family regulator